MGDMADMAIEDGMQEELDREVEAASLGALMERLEADILEALWEELRPFEVSLADAERTLEEGPEHLSTRDRTVTVDALCRCRHLAGVVAKKLALSAPRKAPEPPRAPGRPKVTVAPGTPRPTPLPPSTQAQGVSPDSWLNHPYRPRLMTPMTRAEAQVEAARVNASPPAPVSLSTLWAILDLEVEAAQTQAPDTKKPTPTILVYTDGSGTVDPKPCSCGFVFEVERREQHTVLYGRGVPLGPGTNNRGELSGILYALRMIPPRFDTCPIELRSDSEYALGACMNNQARANADLIRDLRLELRRFSNIILRHVPGHAGLPGNELADRLAHHALKGGIDVETT